MKVLLSIKPEFAEKIFSGEKKYEYRRIIFKSKEVNKIIVYVTSPVKKIIGEIEIDTIINATLEELWNKTFEYSGIDKDFYYKYFFGKKEGYAIKIKRTKLYNKSRDLTDYNIKHAPQSFVYLS